MATTRSITSDDSIEVTTFYGGMDYGRCFVFHDRKNNVDATVNEAALLNFIREHEGDDD